MNRTKLPIEALFPKLMHAALAKFRNDADARDLVQDTVLAALRAEAAGTVIENPEAYLMRTLENLFHSRLRLKYGIPVFSIDDDSLSDLISDEADAEESLIAKEDMEAVRREVAFLAAKYREVIVRFYLKGESVDKIADALSLPHGTVKSRLDTGRKTLRKELIMKNYDTQSYEPKSLSIGICGSPGFGQTPFSLIGGDVLAQNVLLYAYEKPMTSVEIARGLGIAVGYIEPALEKLTTGELMRKTDGGKYYTDFIIYRSCGKYFSPQKQFAEKYAQKVRETLHTALETLLRLPFLKEQTESVRRSAAAYFAINTLSNAIIAVEKRIAPDPNYADFPNRPGNGRWYAMGFLHEEQFVDVNCRYTVDGTNSGEVRHSGKTYTVIANDSSIGGTYHHFRLSLPEAGRLILSVNDSTTVEALDTKLIEQVETFCRLDILHRDTDGTLYVGVPIFSKEEHQSFRKLMKETETTLITLFGTELEAFLRKNRMEAPPHVGSMPSYMHYFPAYRYLSMLLIYEADEKEGLFPIPMKGEDGNYLAPALILFEK